jgi:hypothetical protein
MTVWSKYRNAVGCSLIGSQYEVVNMEVTYD